MPNYERTVKQSHLDTIYYEIDMLRFSGEKILARNDYEAPELNLLIEGFLLHYRNLLEFFSGQKHRDASPNGPQSSADLSTKRPQVWGDRDLTPAERKEIVESTDSIFEPDWKDISQYLQHCTERRFRTARDWDVGKMLLAMNKIVAVFEKGFPREKPARITTGGVSSSTATFIERVGSTSPFTSIKGREVQAPLKKEKPTTVK